MKFEIRDGKQYIILNPFESVNITTTSELYSKKLTVRNGKDGLTIGGDASIVGSIRGEGMLEKVYIPPMVSKEEIIKKCDEWLNMFKKIFDTYHKLLTQLKVIDIETVAIRFDTYSSSYDNVSGKSICVDIELPNYTVKEGATICIDDKNESIYEYLVANVLDYFMSKHFKGSTINLENFQGVLYVGDTRKPYLVRDMLNIEKILDDEKYKNLTYAIISSYNLGYSVDQIIDNLRNNITDMELGDRMDASIARTIKKYKNIIE